MSLFVEQQSETQKMYLNLLFSICYNETKKHQIFVDWKKNDLKLFWFIVHVIFQQIRLTVATIVIIIIVIRLLFWKQISRFGKQLLWVVFNMLEVYKLF